MHALLSVAKGGPDKLVLSHDAAKPEPAKGEVRIRVHAAALNFPDLLLIEDKYQDRPARPFAPGSEVAGIIDALGPDVSGFEIGQRVMAVTSWGGLAEYACALASKTSPITDSMSFEDASALLVTYGTAWHALTTRAALKAGETLLVLGASGGVGLAAIQLGKALGAKVVAAASSEEKLIAAREAGADEGVVYPTGEMTMEQQKALSASFKQACGPQGASVIFDPVGGAYCEPAFRAIGWEGRYLVIGFATGIPSLPLNLPLLKGASIIGIYWADSLVRDPAGHQKAVAELVELYEKGLVRPNVHSVWPLAKGGEALAFLSSRKATGKLVVSLQED